MGTYHVYAPGLAYLAWDTIFVPVVPLANGDHQMFTGETGVVSFATEDECRAFLAKQAHPESVEVDEDDEVTGGAYSSDQGDYVSAVSEFD